MLNTNRPMRTVPRKIEVFKAKEELNIEKQTTPIETSVTAREIFKHENDYEEYLEMLKTDLATLKAKYNEVLNSLEEELPRKISDKEEDVDKHDSQSMSLSKPGKSKFLKFDLNGIRSFIKVV